MNTVTFPCPYCSSPLRIQDRAFTDRAVGCPECGEQIEVKLDRNKEPVAHKVAPEEPEPLAKRPPRIWGKGKLLRKKRQEKKVRSKTTSANGSQTASDKPARAARKVGGPLQERFAHLRETLFSPVGIAWTVAGLVALLLIIMAWPSGDKNAKRSALDDPVTATEPAEDDPLVPANEDLVPGPAPNLPDEPPPLEAHLLAAKYTDLHAGIQSYVKQNGRYPQGTVTQGEQPIDKRFGWQAELFVQRSQEQEPQWDQPWNDPLNDRFVRQQQEAYLNPFIPDRVGVDRYPATHFVGVAGVGTDALTLPANHPRAGIFGTDRITRPEDIQDGQANTMMVAGVMNHFGSWAAGGQPTIRPFTQEPYFEGPDGFGTGEAEGMSVLMADGSVKFLSKNTAPVIVRRMAAMADGWPLDETIPGEPGEQPTAKPEPEKPETEKSEPTVPPAVAHADPMPVEITTQKPKPIEEPPVPKAPDPEPPMPLDIPAALAVKLVKFEQTQNVPLKELLFQVEELAGVPIRLADNAPSNDDSVWSLGVSLRLKDTTVGDVLKAVLEKAKLRYTIESDHIRIEPAHE